MFQIKHKIILFRVSSKVVTHSEKEKPQDIESCLVRSVKWNRCVFSPDLIALSNANVVSVFILIPGLTPVHTLAS